MPDDDAIKTLSFQALRNATFPREQSIITSGLLPSNGLMFIAGPPKSYKSFVTGTAAYHLITGTPLFGAYRKPHGRPEMAFNIPAPQRVLLLEQEIGYYDVRERFLPLYGLLSAHEQLLFDSNLFIHSRDHTCRLDTAEGAKRIQDIIASVQPNVVIFDPLIEFHACNENDSQSMALLMRNLDALRNAYHFAVIMCHHTGKPDANNGRSGPDLLRGSSVIYGKGDSFLMLTPLNRNHGQLKIDFIVRRGPPLHPLSLLLDWQELRAKFHCWADRRGAIPLLGFNDGEEDAKPQ